MEVAPNQMSKLNKEWVNERARSVPQNDGLLLCEREVHSLREAVGEENQATIIDVIKTNKLGQSCITHNRRFISSGEIPDSE